MRLITVRGGEHWAEYNDSQQGRAARPLCAELITLDGDGAGRDAIDLGCGAGIETRALLSAGWRVYATDAAPGTRERVLAATDETDPARLTVEVTDLRTLRDLPHADLIYAGYSLPYVGPNHLPAVWRVIRARLRPGAWLGVNLFGENDSWAGNPDEVFLGASAARALFDGLDVLRFDEVEEDGPAYSGTKHWHTFDVIARMPTM
ncbi:class I SAM-dependent methyltransferase [Actinoplanes sp. NPDC051411]|uniref:class I SAM-dependent methyltransferase n=1 Tax=Actinoplanes sp. NPDC051411 TaxID=3155522 RepID=UPI003440AF39